MKPIWCNFSSGKEYDGTNEKFPIKIEERGCGTQIPSLLEALLGAIEQLALPAISSIFTTG